MANKNNDKTRISIVDAESVTVTVLEESINPTKVVAFGLTPNTGDRNKRSIPREEFLRVEDDLRVAFPEDAGDCNITTVERILDLSFTSALIYTIPGGVLFIFMVFAKITGYFDEVKEPKSPTCFEKFLECFLLFLSTLNLLSCTLAEVVMSCMIIFRLRKQTACLREDDDFEELSIRLRNIIILDSFIIAPFFILILLGVLLTVYNLIKYDPAPLPGHG